MTDQKAPVQDLSKPTDIMDTSSLNAEGKVTVDGGQDVKADPPLVKPLQARVQVTAVTQKMKQGTNAVELTQIGGDSLMGPDTEQLTPSTHHPRACFYIDVSDAAAKLLGLGLKFDITFTKVN